jgi:hypothetical protein
MVLLLRSSRGLILFRTTGTHAKTPTKEVKVEAANLSQLAIQDRKVISVRLVGVALFIKFEKVEGKTGSCCRRRG